MNLNNESGRVGTYQGAVVFVVEEKKFRSEKSNKKYIYALGHQGTYEKLNLIIWSDRVLDWINFGSIDADGSNLVEKSVYERDVYGEIKEKIKERKEKEEVDIDLDKMSAEIDRFLDEAMEKVWEV